MKNEKKNRKLPNKGSPATEATEERSLDTKQADLRSKPAQSHLIMDPNSLIVNRIAALGAWLIVVRKMVLTSAAKLGEGAVVEKVNHVLEPVVLPLVLNLGHELREALLMIAAQLPN